MVAIAVGLEGEEEHPLASVAMTVYTAAEVTCNVEEVAPGIKTPSLYHWYVTAPALVAVNVRN